ncbi:MAG TPA: hypothetical protein VK588_09535 [Chitinophagaceae bacterium]|nr:hypothetical protein [Chitinophagaceae bacterium]
MKKAILFISIITAAGLTMVTVYNSLVDFKSWSGDVPSSILVAREYYRHIDPRNFFSVIAPINQIAILLTVILFWRSSVHIRANFIGSFIIYAGIGALTIFYFIPRDIIIFARPMEGNLEVIKTALHQWQYMNWVRTALGLAGIFFSLKGLDLYYKIPHNS